MSIHVLVQASSRSWQGGTDLCINPIEGKPAVLYTVEKFLSASDQTILHVIAPEFDKDGLLPEIFASLDPERVHIQFSHNESPLLRMIEATKTLPDNDCIIRVDGLHFAVLEKTALEMQREAKQQQLDCLKFPDDFPVQLTADIYKVGALRALADGPLEGQFAVHPKFALLSKPDKYVTDYIPAPKVSNNYILTARELARPVYEPRNEVNHNAVRAGDLLSFHYEIAKKYLPPDSVVLDCACGNGYGSRILASSATKVVGGDIDAMEIRKANLSDKGELDISFQVIDITQIPFDNEYFDAVISMETIEHVDDEQCLKEIKRVLKDGGITILSTPQNALGKIPINAEHEREYSLREFTELCQRHFEIIEVIGIKQGRVIIPDSPRGNNMIVICRKRQLGKYIE